MSRARGPRGCWSSHRAQFEHDLQSWPGQPHDLYGFDELPEFWELQFRFVIGWNRARIQEPFGGELSQERDRLQPHRVLSSERRRPPRMDNKAAQEFILTALDLFFDRDADMPPDVGERCVAHRVAIYLEESLRAAGHTWSVDCEYNRRGGDAKRLAGLVGRRRRLGGKRAGLVLPDIIVHRRGNQGPNVIAIEVKRLENDDIDDLEKLRLYKKELRYEHVFMLLIAAGRQDCHLVPV